MCRQNGVTVTVAGSRSGALVREEMSAPGPPAGPSGPSRPQSFLQARCQEPIMTTDWGLPLFIALVLLGLLYAFLYLPATQHHALQEALANQTEAVAHGKGDRPQP